MIIDFHTHTFPDKIAEAAISSLEKGGGIKRAIDGKLSDLRISMEKNRIDKSVSLPVATREKQVESINDSAIALLGDEQIIPFGCMHPLYENPEKELLRLKNAEIKGIKLHPEYQGVPIDAKETVRILSICRDLDLICVIHSGRDIAFPDSLMCPPESVKRLMRDLSGTKLVLAHMGGWGLWDKIVEIFDGNEVYIDTSFSFSYLGAEKMAKMLNYWDKDRVLFGTDSPWDNQSKSAEDIKSIGLDDDYFEKIMHKNAEMLLAR